MILWHMYIIINIGWIFLKIKKKIQCIFWWNARLLFCPWISKWRISPWSWVQNGPQFGISSIETIENFVDKCVTIDQTLLLVEIHCAQIHQHKWTCWEKNQPICWFQYSKPPMKSTTILLPLDEHDRVPKFHEIANNILKKLVDMGLGVDISFEKFLIDLNVNEENYIFANLRSIVRKPTLFLKHKVNDIRTNVFSIHVRPIWEANIGALYYPYFVATYYTSYLTKVNKSVTQEMQSMLKKCKHEQYETSKRIKKLRNTFKNAQQKSIQQVVHISLSIPLSLNKIITIHTCNEHERIFVLLPQKNYTIYPLC